MKRSAYAYAAPEPKPIGEMNTTPLIDVLLVLLIMFILTVPVATHKVALDLPRPAPSLATLPSVHRLAIDAGGAVTLDGARVREAALAARLRLIAADARATLTFAPDPEVRYETGDRVLATVKRAGVERMAFAR